MFAAFLSAFLLSPPCETQVSECPPFTQALQTFFFFFGDTAIGMAFSQAVLHGFGELKICWSLIEHPKGQLGEGRRRCSARQWYFSQESPGGDISPSGLPSLAICTKTKELTWINS